VVDHSWDILSRSNLRFVEPRVKHRPPHGLPQYPRANLRTKSLSALSGVIKNTSCCPSCASVVNFVSRFTLNPPKPFANCAFLVALFSAFLARVSSKRASWKVAWRSWRWCSRGGDLVLPTHRRAPLVPLPSHNPVRSARGGKGVGRSSICRRLILWEGDAPAHLNNLSRHAR